MNLIESLQNLGLDEKEAKVYLALLQLGKSTAYSVAVRSGLKKPTTYVVLENLIDKGLCLKVPRAKKALFSAVNPEELFSVAETRLRTAEQALPELLAVKKGEEKGKTSVSYFEGIDGFREVYKKLMKNMEGKESIGFYAHQKDTPEPLKEYWNELNVIMRKKKIKRRVITTYHDTILYYLQKTVIEDNGLVIKALSEDKYNSNISLEVYDNFTLLASHKHLQAVLIENINVANVILQIFEMIWDLVEKDKENYLRFSSVDNASKS